MKTLTLLLLTALSGASLSAQTVTFSGQVRERSELDDRSFVQGTHHDVYHLLRSRIGATFTLDSTLSARVELQDARSFGATGTALNSGAPALDMRHAYVAARGVAGLPVDLRLGRQTLSYANERLLGAADWGNLGQSFDGIVGSVRSDSLRLDLIGAAIRRNPSAPEYTRDHILAGGWGLWNGSGGKVNLQAFHLFDNPSGDSIRRQRHTSGLYGKGRFGGLDLEVDGAYQYGTVIRRGVGEADRSAIAASLIGARAGYTLAKLAGLRVGVGYDRLSGTAVGDDDADGAFNNLYGTNHKFYGQIDLLDNAAQTRGMGLHDLFLQLSVAPSPTLKLGADIHRFATVTDGVTAASTPIGYELDLNAAYAPSKALAFSMGYALFDGDRDRVLARGRKTTQWAFVMMAVTFDAIR